MNPKNNPCVQTVIQIATTIFFSGWLPTFPENFMQIRSDVFAKLLSQTNKQTNKPVGFYGPIAPPGPKAPSSECPPNKCYVMSCHVPLWPIRTIMAAARLDHSRVLVTKFHQNRSTLNGRSADKSYTHTHVEGVARSLCGRSGPLCSGPN